MSLKQDNLLHLCGSGEKHKSKVCVAKLQKWLSISFGDGMFFYFFVVNKRNNKFIENKGKLNNTDSGNGSLSKSSE